MVGSSWFWTGSNWGAVATVGAGGVIVTADGTAVAVTGGVAVAIGAGKDRIGDGLAQADVDGLFVGGAERHAVIIQRGA